MKTTFLPSWHLLGEVLPYSCSSLEINLHFNNFAKITILENWSIEPRIILFLYSFMGDFLALKSDSQLSELISALEEELRDQGSGMCQSEPGTKSRVTIVCGRRDCLVPTWWDRWDLCTEFLCFLFGLFKRL